MSVNAPARTSLGDTLVQAGLRSTKQREQVFAVLLQVRDHPSADEVYARAKAQMPTISLATVYNCLESLVSCGLVRAVNFEREPTRFCPNLSEHAHFVDRRSGRVYDIDLPPDAVNSLRALLPPGFDADEVDLSFHGKVPVPPPTGNLSKSKSKSKSKSRPLRDRDLLRNL